MLILHDFCWLDVWCDASRGQLYKCFLKNTYNFPIEFYNIRMRSHLQKRLEALEEMPEDMWGRHIQRMEQNKKKKNDGEL